MPHRRRKLPSPSTRMPDIRQEKARLRRSFIESRRALPEGERLRRSGLITERLLASDIYKQCSTLLLYISTPLEIDTHAILSRAMEDGKRLACPRCGSAEGQMTFRTIRSPEQLVPGSYGILEPPESLPETDCTGALCILPALACDRGGYRLGYGKGYYDRFLAGFDGISAALCYDDALLAALPHDEFDRPADRLVLESGILCITDR